MSGESWLAIPGFEGLYEVSDQGRVRSLNRTTARKDRWGRPSQIRVAGGLLKPSPFGKSGHVCVNLWSDGQGVCRQIHRIVLETFVGPRQAGMECRHLNGVADDNRLANLVWGTRSENMADRTRLGEHNPHLGEARPNAVLTEKIVRTIRVEKAQGCGGSEIARRLGLNINTVFGVLGGRNWSWVE